jgi:integrase
VAPGIYKAAAGAYDVHVSAGKGPDGKYGQLTRRVRGTLGEAKAERGRMLAEVQSGQLSARTDITVAELHRQFMAIKTKLSPASISQYEYVWEKLRPHIGDRPLRKLRAIDLDRAYVAIGQSVSANTTIKCHKHAVALLQQAMKWELVPRNVALSATPPDSVPFNVRPPTGDELVKIVTAAKESDWQFGALVHLGATTGARRGELAGLRWCDVDLDNASVRLVHQPDGAGGLGPLKNKLARTVLLDDDSVTMLRSHRERCEQVAAECGGSLTEKCFVFSPTPGNTESFRPDGLTWRFRRLAAAVGVDARLHDLRHAQATTLLANGISPAAVAARLGHSSPAITMSIYAHSDIDQERKAARAGGLKS